MNYRFAEAESAIRVLFDAEWQARTVIEWPNDPINANPTMMAWVRFAMDWAEGRRVSIGRPAFHRIPGMVTVQVFAAQDSGDGGATELCDIAAGILGDRVVDAGGKIRFRTPSVTKLGLSGVWWQQNVTCAFTRDVIG